MLTQASVAPIPVKVIKVRLQSISDKIESVGTLLANQSIEISPELPGHVSKILFKAGDRVKKGEPLIQLDDSINQANLKSAEAELALSQSMFARTQWVVKKGAQAKEALDHARADLKEKEAAVAVSKVNLKKMTLVAPFDGVIGARNISAGEYVSVGQGLLTIVDKNELRVRFSVPERYFARLRLGQVVTVETEAYPGQQFQGHVDYIAPYVNATTGSVELEAVIPNADGRLSPGLFVRIEQRVGIEKNTPVIPEDSLVPSLEGEHVYKVVDGKAVDTKIKVGARFNGKVQVLSGLSVGDVVVVAGQDTIKDGSAVREL